MNSPNKSLKPRDVIEKIRTEVYLLDIEKESEQIRNGAKNLQIQLNNALKLLSDDLYSKKSHFVLELVQNADDNDYPPGVVPKLIFSLAPKQLVLINNEVGFSEPNVQALCRVGQSSKANKSGYIGEKGIGFKSVFTVSNAPEIHSNGYHFRFDRRDEANLLGYVVPQWCEPPEETNPKVTTIILPAADNFEFSRETLEDLDARLLLFLSKVREVTLQHDEKKLTYRRRDKDGLSYLTTEARGPEAPPKTEENRYVRVAVDFPMTEFPDEKRPGVLKSSLVLAFSVDSDGAASPEPSSKVFAFLPIRQVGFKFSIQADFILSSSREDILTDRPWNKFLRVAISAAFKIAISSFKKTDELAFSYLKYLPAAGEISDPFFKPVAESILKALAQAESLPSAAGQWTLPSALRIARKGFRDLFSSELALELFGFDYVDARVQGSDELLRKLGVKDILLSDVLSVFEQHGSWLKQQSLEWKARFFAYIAVHDVPALINAGLAKLPCVPTNTGDFVIPDQTSVFYPLSKGKKYGFEHELVIVDSELLEHAQQHSERVQNLFAALKVRRDDPYDLVTSHILPRHHGESWMPYVDAAMSISMLDHCGTTHRLDAKACIKRLMQLKTEGGETIKQLQAIYRHLERLWDSDSAYIKLSFASDGLIRTKDARTLWAKPSQVAWHSNGPFLDSLYPPLQGQYRDFSGFFLNKLGIPKELPTAKWVDALAKLGTVATIEERRRVALAIYKRANRDLTPHFGQNDVPTPGWLDTFEDGKVFLNHRDELVPNDELLFANDAPDLASLFSDSPDVSFLDVSSEEVPRIGRLLDATNVQRVSASVVVKVVEAAGGRLDAEMTNRTRRAASHLGRLLYAKSHASFENALEQGLFLRLRELEVIEVPELKLSVSLGETSRITTANIARDMDRIFVKAGTRSVIDQLATELPGPDVSRTGVDGGDAQADAVVRRVQQWVQVEDLRPEDVVVLVAKRPKAHSYDLLEQRGEAAGITWAVEAHGQKRSVLIDTVARFKGLEAQAVVLWLGDEISDEKQWETVYVGTTRAKSLLAIVASQKTLKCLRAR